VCVQTLQVQLQTAATAKTKTALAPAAALTFTNSIDPFQSHFLRFSSPIFATPKDLDFLMAKHLSMFTTN
jgi:hypothetical protein